MQIVLHKTYPLFDNFRTLYIVLLGNYRYHCLLRAVLHGYDQDHLLYIFIILMW